MAEHNEPIAYREGSTIVFRMSSFGGCVKGLAAALAGIEGAGPPANLRKAFAEGHEWEDYILDQVELAYSTDVTRRQDTSEWLSHNFLWRGHPDGFVSIGGWEAVVDAKNLGPSYSRSLALEGLVGMGDLGYKYAMQGWMYCKAWGVTNFILAARNKEDDTVICYEFDIEDLEEIIGMDEIGVVAKAERVKDTAAKGNILGAECEVEAWGCPFWFLHTDDIGEGLFMENDIEFSPQEQEVFAGLVRAEIVARTRMKEAEAAKEATKTALASFLNGRAPMPDELNEDTKDEVKFSYDMEDGTKVTRYQSGRAGLDKVAMVDDGIDLKKYEYKTFFPVTRITLPKEKADE